MSKQALDRVLLELVRPVLYPEDGTDVRSSTAIGSTDSHSLNYVLLATRSPKQAKTIYQIVNQLLPHLDD